MKACIWLGVLAAVLLPATAKSETSVLNAEKAELMGRVEDVFLHNFRDITWRRSLEWGEVQTQENGLRTIRYTFEAMIWDRERLILSQEFTFAQDGACLRFENVAGFPKTKALERVDVATRKGMIDLVEDFFGKNYRDITARKTLEWEKLSKDKKGNSSISYKYEATFWNRNKKVMHQVFTFDPSGKFVSVKDVEGNRQKTNAVESSPQLK